MRPMPELKVEEVGIDDLYEYVNNSKIHDHENIENIANSIDSFGFDNPVLAWHNEDGDAEIVAGHGRVRAAKKLGIEKVPTIFLDHLTDSQRRALSHTLNQTTLSSGFDFSILDREFEELGAEFDFSDFGFKMDTIMTDDEIDEFFIEAVNKAEEKSNQPTPENHEQGRPVEAVSLRRTITCPECGHEFEL